MISNTKSKKGLQKFKNIVHMPGIKYVYMQNFMFIGGFGY